MNLFYFLILEEKMPDLDDRRKLDDLLEGDTTRRSRRPNLAALGGEVKR